MTDGLCPTTRRGAGGRSLLAAAALCGAAVLEAESPTAAPTPTSQSPSPPTGVAVSLNPRPLTAVRADSAALLLAGGEGGPVRLALLALPGFRPDGSPRLFLYAEIAGESLLREAPDGPLGVEISVYLLDGKGTVVAHSSEGLRLPPPGERSTLAAGGIRYGTALDLPPGDYTARLLARLRPSGGLGLREARVRLSPAARPGAPASPLQPVPLWPAAAGTWMEARSPSLAPTEPPRLPSGAWPSPFPVATAGRELPFLLAVPARSRPDSPLAARLAPLVGGEERAASATVGESAGSLGAGLEALSATLDAQGAAPGAYALRFGETPVLRLVLAPPTSGGTPPPSWVMAVRARTATSAPAAVTAGSDTPEPVERTADRDAEVARLRGELLAAFDQLAGGELGAATDTLLAVEVTAFERAPRRALGWLEEAHGQIRAALATADPEILLPLTLAYADLAEKAAVARRTALSQLAQEAAGQLAGEYARRGAGTEASELAIRTYLALAGRFYELGSPRRAQRLLAEADGLDAGDGTAARLVAFIHERHDERAEAARVLRRLLERRPGDREARLHLGICELALGESGGLRRLRGLLAEPAGDWVGAVAAQEVARAELGDRRFDAAAGVAREGLRRYPADPGLRTQLSWALQQSGRPGESLAALDPLLARGGVVPPRRRYSAWPRETLREAGRAVEEASQLRLPALRAALARLPAGNPTGGGS